MKKMATALILGAAVAGSMNPVMAGDREWATAGKVLTGVFAAGVLAEAFRPHVYAPTTAVVYQTPPNVVVQSMPAPVVYTPPPPTVVQSFTPPVSTVTIAPARVVYQPRVVVTAPPVMVAPPPVFVPAPVVVYGYPYGHVHHRVRFAGRFCW